MPSWKPPGVPGMQSEGGNENGWLALGVADGDIEYGDLSVGPDDADELEYYMEDEPFADLMDTFLRCMAHARRDGGLYCDGVVSKEA